jgi:hypothetical protein
LLVSGFTIEEPASFAERIHKPSPWQQYETPSLPAELEGSKEQRNPSVAQHSRSTLLSGHTSLQNILGHHISV